MTSSSSSPGRRRDIQGLRALAVGLVVLAHAGAPGLAGGFIGVDVFFVISGFLITSLLLREARERGRVSIGAFYARRARRILPAATVLLMAVLAWFAVTGSAARLTRAVHDAGWSALFLANVHFSRIGTDYFANQEPSPFQHYWSLAVEEQFYLVWPLLIAVLAARLTRRRLVPVIALLGALSLVIAIHQTSTSPAAAYFSSPARAYELIAGALLAAMLAPGRGLPQAPARLFGAVGAVLVIGGALTFGADAPFPGSAALVPVVGTVLLLWAGTSARPTAVTTALGWAPFGLIGDLSYSLYLWHWPVLKFGGGLLPAGLPTAVERAGLIGIAVLLSYASYRLVERPFLDRRLPLSIGRRSLLLWPAALASVALVAGLSSAYASHVSDTARVASTQWFDQHPKTAAGTVAPDPAATAGPLEKAVSQEIGAALALADEGAPLPPALDVAGLADDNWHQDYHCAAGFGDSEPDVCPYGDLTAERVVAIVGDSHAGHWLPALDALGRSEHFKLVPVIKMGCSPYPLKQYYAKMPQAECDTFRTRSHQVLATLHPDVVIVSARGEIWMRPEAGASVDQQWSVAVHAGLKTLGKLAPTVVQLSDFPHRQDAQDCLTQPGVVQRDCLTDPVTPGSGSNALTLAAVKGTGAQWVDVLPLVCYLGRCPEVVGDLPLFYDDSHLSLSWAKHVTPALGELLGDTLRG